MDKSKPMTVAQLLTSLECVADKSVPMYMLVNGKVYTPEDICITHGVDACISGLEYTEPL